MSSLPFLAHNLAAAFLAGPWSLESFVELGARSCTDSRYWLRPLARRVLAAFAARPVDRTLEGLAHFIANDRGFRRSAAGAVQQIFWATPTMLTAGPAKDWAVPPLVNSTALAEWLGLTPRELDWFADAHGHETHVRPGPLRHYTYRWVPKRIGHGRLIEVPKARLKAIQRRILHEILDCIPCHDAAHGFRPGRSVVTFSSPHCGQNIVLRFDLRDFFPSITAARIHAVFRTAGYPVAVARSLTGLSTNGVPADAWDGVRLRDAQPIPWEHRQRYRFPHLPQGAPTSPALANLCAQRLDCRLHALARKIGGNYTRYADDLAFSGGVELERCARRFQVRVAAIALEEGFEVNTRKSRFMRQGVRQQLAGVVVNAHPNLRRADYDRLKAILHNCTTRGPTAQNTEGHADFRAYLLGRIAHATSINPARGQRLRDLYERIDWAIE